MEISKCEWIYDEIITTKVLNPTIIRQRFTSLFSFNIPFFFLLLLYFNCTVYAIKKFPRRYCLILSFSFSSYYLRWSKKIIHFYYYLVEKLLLLLSRLVFFLLLLSFSYVTNRFVFSIDKFPAKIARFSPFEAIRFTSSTDIFLLIKIVLLFLFSK